MKNLTCLENYSLLLLTLGLLCISFVYSEDFYSTLGISKHATDRELRKAFKKKALELHPDKNLDKPGAQEKFIKLNRAYEVLKDEEMRKKYDLFGEEGLDRSWQNGKSYHSWNYYHDNFGIYDDNPQIITLNRADFEQSVLGSEDVWFINFYHPMCSHCHTLAPIWQQLAMELDGVVRIGAVNCDDSFNLCSSQGIRSYPSLLAYPGRIHFTSEKSKENLIQFILAKINPSPEYKLSGGKWKLQAEECKRKPWLILMKQQYEDEDDFRIATIKLREIFDGLLCLAEVDCSPGEEPCLTFGIENTYKFFHSLSDMLVGKGYAIENLNPQEVAREVLELLPDVPEFNPMEYETMKKELTDGEGKKPTDGEEKKPTDGEGRTPTDGEGRKQTDGEGRKPTDGEGRKPTDGEGKKPTDGEGRKQTDGEGRKQSDGEGRKPTDGEGRKQTYGEGRKQSDGEGRKPTDGEGRKQTDGEGKKPTDGEGRKPTDGEGRKPTDGEGRKQSDGEGRKPTDGEGRKQTDGEGRKPTDGEGRKQTYGEGKKPTDGEGRKPYLIIFTSSGDEKTWETRKLPALLPSFNIRQLKCEEMRKECDNLFILKTPAFLLFKVGGGYEMHYGRNLAHDVAVFAREGSLATQFQILTPNEFPSNLNSGIPWFVDFYAPWCPPCMRLLPEFRKASRIVDIPVKFGSIDCTIHSSLCNHFNIRQYPTTILYYQNVPHHYHGQHLASHLVDFVKDTLHPTVITLTTQSFNEKVVHKSEKELWVVDFYANWCGHCIDMAPEFRRFSRLVGRLENVFVAQVDCAVDRQVCQGAGVNSYPTIKLYPFGYVGDKRSIKYSGWSRDAESFRQWLFSLLPSEVELLDDRTFEDMLRDATPWLVDFYAPWCSHCHTFAPEFEEVAKDLKGRVRCGKVNCDTHNWLCKSAGVRAYPMVKYFKGASLSSPRQNVYGLDVGTLNKEDILDFVRRATRNTKEEVANNMHDEL